MNLDDLEKSAWFPELKHDIESALKDILGSHTNQPSQLQRELETLRQQKSGWKKSLGDPNLSPSLREEIHADYEHATARESEIIQELKRREDRQQYLQNIFAPSLVLDCLNRLDQVLAGDNATLGNMELSLHIDRIDCFDDGHIEMRVCRLGALAECVELLSTEGDEGSAAEADSSPQNKTGEITPRRRSKRRVEAIGRDAVEQDAIAEFAADPDRFAGLGEEWFETYEFEVPTEKHWYQLQATEVAKRRRDGLTHAQLSAEFGVTVPTIRKSLNYAAEKDPTLSDLPRKMSRLRWHEEHADAVQAKHAAGLSTKELVEYFGKSDTTILKALRFAETKKDQPTDT